LKIIINTALFNHSNNLSYQCIKSIGKPSLQFKKVM